MAISGQFNALLGTLKRFQAIRLETAEKRGRGRHPSPGSFPSPNRFSLANSSSSVSVSPLNETGRELLLVCLCTAFFVAEAKGREVSVGRIFHTFP